MQLGTVLFEYYTNKLIPMYCHLPCCVFFSELKYRYVTDNDITGIQVTTETTSITEPVQVSSGTWCCVSLHFQMIHG